MATRAIIEIEDINFAKIYKHYDGDPNTMLAWLETFNQSFTKILRNDPEYKFAQLLRQSQSQFPQHTTTDFSGWAILPYNTNTFFSYHYTLHKNGNVSYYKYKTTPKQPKKTTPKQRKKTTPKQLKKTNKNNNTLHQLT